MRVKRQDKRIWYIILATFVMVFSFVFLRGMTQKEEIEAEAASLASFDPGYIISDYTMGNYNSMTEVEIQAFLTSKNSCRNTNYDQYVALSANSSYKWHFENGHFVCLSEELFGDGEVIGKGETAAHIIWQAAQDYKINPQALIVLLQKETSLITDTYPNNGDYRKATGYGCPDTAPCSSQYYGFKNQVRKAAALFHQVLTGGWTNYPLGNNYIQYNPSASCGGSVVNIRSLATSALYRYTPYQPNASAISAGYGNGDKCGAYGNRNFYLYFEDWFGGITREGELAVEAITKYERPVNDGLYQIYSKAYPEKVIDIRGGVWSGMTSAETLVYGRKKEISDNQVFYIKYNEKSGYYNIYNVTSGLYLDVKGASIKNSTPLIMYQGKTACNQDWLLQKGDDGYLTIISRCSSKVLDATSDGRLIIYPNHSGDNQKWQLFAMQEGVASPLGGEYQIIISENKVFDISGGIKEGMTSGKIVSFQNKKQENQIFKISYDAQEQKYKIINSASELYLTSGDVVSVTKSGSLCNQWWIIEKNESGYVILSSCDRKGLSVSGTKVGSSYAITSNGNKNETMTLQRAENTSVKIIPNDKTYQIKLRGSDKAIDISGGVVNNMQSGNLVAFSFKLNNNLNQQFKFLYDEQNQAYYIYNPTSGLRLDVARAGIEDGSKVIGYKDNGGECNQLWRAEKIGDGYSFESLCSGKKLMVGDYKVGSAYGLAINASADVVWELYEL